MDVENNSARCLCTDLGELILLAILEYLTEYCHLSEELYILAANILKFLFISIIFQVVGLALNIGG